MDVESIVTVVILFIYLIYSFTSSKKKMDKNKPGQGGPPQQEQPYETVEPYDPFEEIFREKPEPRPQPEPQQKPQPVRDSRKDTGLGRTREKQSQVQKPAGSLPFSERKHEMPKRVDAKTRQLGEQMQERLRQQERDEAHEKARFVFDVRQAIITSEIIGKPKAFRDNNF